MLDLQTDWKVFEVGLQELGWLCGHLGSILGPSWKPLGASWGNLGSILDPSWSILEHLGASWAHLGNILGPLGAILGANLLHDTLYVRKPIKTNGFLRFLVSSIQVPHFGVAEVTGGTDPLRWFCNGFWGAGGRWEGGHDPWLLATWLLATWLLATWLCRSVQLADAPHSRLPPASRGPAD